MATQVEENSSDNVSSEFKHDTCGNYQARLDAINTPQPLLLPNDTSNDARIVTLRNHLGIDSRYLICPIKGFHELRNFTSSQSLKRSLLLHPNYIVETTEIADNRIKICPNPAAYIMQNDNLLIATAIDPLFIILPSLILLSDSTLSRLKKRLFLPFTDYLEQLTTNSSQHNYFLEMVTIRNLLKLRMVAVCDMVEVDDEKMYRLNENKLTKEILVKAKRMASSRLPLSMEENLIKEPLEFLKYSIGSEEYHACESNSQEDRKESRKDDRQVSDMCTPDMQRPVSPINMIVRQSDRISDTALINVNSPSERLQDQMSVSEKKISDILRIRISLSFIFSNYLSPHIVQIVKDLLLNSSIGVEFNSLDNYLAKGAKLRQDALNARSNHDFSRKRFRSDKVDDQTKTQKKRRDEDSKKLVNCSRGVKALRRANINGMKKMSEFFNKS